MKPTSFALLVGGKLVRAIPLLVVIVYCGIAAADTSHLAQERAIDECLRHLEAIDEYRLQGAVVHYIGGSLSGFSTIDLRFDAVNQVAYFYEESAFNADGVESTAVRSTSEQLSMDLGFLVVNRQCVIPRKLSESELQKLVASSFGESVTKNGKDSGYQLTIRKALLFPCHWGLLLSGVPGLKTDKRNFIDLREALRNEKWKVIDHKLPNLTLETRLSGTRGKLLLELSPRDDYRLVRYELTKDPGDFHNSEKLPTEFVERRIDELKVDWRDGSPVKLVVKATTWRPQKADPGIRESVLTVDLARLGSGSVRFDLISQIPDYAPVILMDSQQIQAYWKDGKIFKKYSSGEVEALASVTMASNHSSRIFFVAICLFALLSALLAFKVGKRKPK